jgi:muramoyltetrapeptide carboxypeptidase
VARLQIPAVYGYSFGHIADQFTLPMGINARLDTEAQTLTLLEPAVLD